MALDRGLYIFLPMIKVQLTQAPVLVYFNPDKEFVIEVDSSGKGLGAVL